MLRRLVLVISLSLIAASPLFAAGFDGHWVLRSGGTVLMRIDIEQEADGWSAHMTRPERFSIGSDMFTSMGTAAITRPAESIVEHDGDLDLRFAGREAGSGQVAIRLHAVDAAHGTATFPDFPTGALLMLREPGEAPLGPLAENASYALPIDRPTNAEMTAIYEADQAARSGPGAIDWSVVSPQDEARRKRTQALLDAGQLQSGEDFLHAAFIFQHGDSPADYMNAHLLAMVAIARGQPRATWIAAATLDRYLQNIGQPQILGTQYLTPFGKPTTQEPYDRALVSDAMRAALGVPPMAEQEKRLVEIGKQMEAARKPK